MVFTRRKSASATPKPNVSSQAKTTVDNVLYNTSQAPSTKKRVAIIGSGISGLSCAHYLAKLHEVTIFEASDYIGGHVNTIDVTLQQGKKAKGKFTETSAIDTGFIVFNERTYPNFFRLLYDLQVPFQATDMSFSVKNTARNFEYNGHTLNTLLSQRKNVLNPKFWRFIKDILHFNTHIKQLRQDFDAAREQAKGDSRNAHAVTILTEQTLGGYLAGKRYGSLFTDNYLLPMVSAIWSSSLKDVQDFPLVFFAQFFDNHGLLDVVNRPQWFTIKGGSKQYVNKLIPRFIKAGGTVRVNTPVQSVLRQDNKVKIVINAVANADITTNISTNLNPTLPTVISEAQELEFDEVIFACHADTALKLLTDASADEREVLSPFHFTNNTAVLHTDTRVLPKRSLAWASWNYLLDGASQGSDKNMSKTGTTSTETNTETSTETAAEKPVLTYHMNILQRLTKQHNYLVTLNPASPNSENPNSASTNSASLSHSIDEAQVIKRIDYSHPIYNTEMIAAQNEWSRISGSGLHTHFCGAYWFNGFHEDGVRSGLRVAQVLGCDIEIKDEVDARHLPDADAAHTPFRYRELPVKADRQPRKLKKRLVTSATTNQELVDYAATLQSKSNVDARKKRGWFGRRHAK